MEQLIDDGLHATNLVTPAALNQDERLARTALWELGVAGRPRA